MTYIGGKIAGIRSLTRSIREYSITLDRSIDPTPGQFAMLWIPRVGEIPLSFADADEDCIKFIVARVGRVTSFIHGNLGEGDRVFVRGPLGKGFTQASGEKCLLVAGGYGLAPLYFLAKKLRENGCAVEALLGFKSDEEVFYREEFARLCEVEVSVEEGSEGFRGTVFDLFEKRVKEAEFDRVYVCGKEAMMLKVMRECLSRGIPVEGSFERYVKCGVGICGSCSIEPLGLRVCRDGPVFSGEALSEILAGAERE
ncbi:MAG TPA: dihydroorotate dehydrogenase electron transfer subunit [Nitrososphaeria archaeon]|nr:dihydroorotate dehydrogenase electron transfer subunit [Nitrososphaeria archaeon]